jgi:hypothetical protein
VQDSSARGQGHAANWLSLKPHHGPSAGCLRPASGAGPAAAAEPFLSARCVHAPCAPGDPGCCFAQSLGQEGQQAWRALGQPHSCRAQHALDHMGRSTSKESAGTSDALQHRSEASFENILCEMVSCLRYGSVCLLPAQLTPSWRALSWTVCSTRY